jgi:hypothetical protein
MMLHRQRHPKQDCQQIGLEHSRPLQRLDWRPSRHPPESRHHRHRPRQGSKGQQIAMGGEQEKFDFALRNHVERVRLKQEKDCAVFIGRSGDGVI